MGYVAKKIRFRENGKSLVRLREDGTPDWQVVYENRGIQRPAGVSREACVRLRQLGSLGIDRKFTFEMVRARCRELNASLPNSQPSAFLPPVMVLDFEQRILLKRFSGANEVARVNRFFTHWKFTKRMIAELKVEPRDYADECFQFYRYFEREKISVAYVAKILRILNAWGRFHSKNSRVSFEAVSLPRGGPRLSIARANHQKKGGGVAEPLTPENLAAAPSFPTHNRNWLYLSVWLGLRPEEIDSLQDESRWKLKTHEDGITPVLWVFQTKITSLAANEAWKPIPLFHPNQKRCLEIIHSKNFKRPIHKTLRRVFKGKRILMYSGRKGFVDLMLAEGQSLENISIWLGHMSIATTWKYYKQKQLVRFRVRER